jgi:hypothetical protein
MTAKRYLHVLGPLLFLVYVNGIWRNTESTIRPFADDCVIYREIVNDKDVEKLRTNLNRLGEWAVENEMIINRSKSKAVCFTGVRVTEVLNYSLRDTVMPEASSCKYLEIILLSDLNWADQVNNTVKKAWKALNFTMSILKMGNKNTKSLAYGLDD